MTNLCYTDALFSSKVLNSASVPELLLSVKMINMFSSSQQKISYLQYNRQFPVNQFTAEVLNR